MRKSVCASLALAIPLACEASEWIEVGESNNGTRYSIDATSLKRAGRGRVLFWSKQEPAGRETFALAQVELDCDEREYRIAHITTYDKDGGVRSSSKGPATLAPIPPDSVADTLQQWVCIADVRRVWR